MKAQIQYSKRISNLIGYCFGAFILLNLADKVFPVDKPWADLVVILPAMVGIALAPVGLYFAIKSYRNQEVSLPESRKQVITFSLISLIGFGIVLLTMLKA